MPRYFPQVRKVAMYRVDITSEIFLYIKVMEPVFDFNPKQFTYVISGNREDRVLLEDQIVSSYKLSKYNHRLYIRVSDDKLQLLNYELINFSLGTRKTDLIVSTILDTDEKLSDMSFIGLGEHRILDKRITKENIHE